jgi:hypothetical protein
VCVCAFSPKNILKKKENNHILAFGMIAVNEEIISYDSEKRTKKFKFSNLKKSFKLSKSSELYEIECVEELSTGKKFSLKYCYRREKKKNREEIVFTTGYGKFINSIDSLASHI